MKAVYLNQMKIATFGGVRLYDAGMNEPQANQSESFGEWLLDELDRRHMLQTDLARELGFSNGAISGWVRRGVPPSGRALRAMARYFGRDWRDLYAIAGRPLPGGADEEEESSEIADTPSDPDRIYASVLEGVHALQLHPDDEAAIERMLTLARTEAARRRRESIDG